MIESNINNKCKLKGHPAELCVEFINIIRAFDELFTGKIGQDASRKVIAVCGKAAFEDDNDARKIYADTIASLIHDGSGQEGKK